MYLFEDIKAPDSSPRYTNSAMDGYAVRAADLPADGVVEFPVPGTSWAGRPWLAAIEPGQAVQIMTGGMMPEGADTVVIQEVCDSEGDAVVILDMPSSGANIRRAGEDTREGDEVLADGIRLQPQLAVGAQKVRAQRMTRSHR